MTNLKWLFLVIAASLATGGIAAVETRLDVVDVLIAYDLSAQNWLQANGRGTVEQHAQACVNKMNFCLASSEISEFSFRLAGVVAVNCDVSGMDFNTLISTELVSPAGKVVARGEMKRICDARETLGADIVSVLVSAGTTGNIGLGYELSDCRQDSDILDFGDWAYNVCSIEATDAGYAQVHEIGHNMGCGHPDASLADGRKMLVGPQLYDFSSGYYCWIDGVGYYTVMGYNFGGIGPDGTFDYDGGFDPVPMFSSPDLTFMGVPMGTAVNDNRKTLLRTYRYVAQYRASKTSDPTPDPTPDPVAQGFFGEKVIANAVVLDGDEPVGMFQATVAKTDRKNMSRVSGSLVGLDGKKRSAKAVKSDVIRVGGVSKVSNVVLSVKDEGDLTLTVDDGGNVSGFFADGRTIATAGSVGVLDNLHPRVSISGVPEIPGLVNDVEIGGVAYHFVPDGDGFAFDASGKKWVFAKNASVKFKKNRETGVTELSVDTGKNGEKGNLSSMKLTCAAKTGIVKGSFVLYANGGTVDRPKLVKHKVSVTGIVIDGRGYGIATSKKLGTPMRIVIR